MIQQAAQRALIGNVQHPRRAAGSGHVQQIRQGQTGFSLGGSLLLAAGQGGRIRADLDRQRRQVRDGGGYLSQCAALAQRHMGIERRLGLLVRPNGHGLDAHVRFGNYVHSFGAGKRGEVSALGFYELLIRCARVGAAEQDYGKEKKSYAAKNAAGFHCGIPWM